MSDPRFHQLWRLNSKILGAENYLFYQKGQLTKSF